MSFIDLEQLPFVGMSYEFHGEKHGAPFSAYIVNRLPSCSAWRRLVRRLLLSHLKL
jgi:hypothetical protein